MQRAAMREMIKIDGLAVAVTRKRIQRMRLVVHPPDGRVTLSVPLAARREEWSAFLTAKLTWIHAHVARTAQATRPAPALYAGGEIHYLWGHPCVLHVEEHSGRTSAVFGSGSIILRVPPGSDAALRESVMHTGYAAQLREAVEPLVGQARAALGVGPALFFARRMKSRWGSCSPRSARIRLNTELAKHPPHLLGYVLVHEMAHLLEPGHNSRFYSLVERVLPDWRTARAELRALSPGQA
ncbi:MAG: M48 family metallopeptidase [Desulfovibrio sp.]|nr:M48 family metallopeptidase [Desulfovibrio sp.]